MKQVRELERFLRDPIERYYAGPTYLVWAASPTLCGSATWGRPNEQHARDLARLFDVTRHPAFAPGHDVWMDSGALEWVDWDALGVLSQFVRSRLAEWGGRIRRQAVIVPAGPSGLILSGLVPLLGMTYPMRFFSSRGEGLAWLARDDLRAVVARLEVLVDEARGTSPMVRALRDYLEHALHAATLEGAARALGTTPRSLQRELRARATSFSAEWAGARVRIASMLLAQSDDKIEAIARRVGCSSASRLAALFRKVHGETPARFRARSRLA